jgi:hypothetical protein
MRSATLVFLLSAVCSSACGQGLINFNNTTATLLGRYLPLPFPDPPGSLFFGLLTAPEGTTDLTRFTFSGLYATNSVAAGRFFGGTSVPVPGWGPGVTRSYFVAGWSSSLGHDWHQGWLSGVFSSPGEFGFSAIGTGSPGGFDTTGPLPPLNLFGGPTGIQSGFTLLPVAIVPEPSALALGVLGSLISLGLRIRPAGARANPRRQTTSLIPAWT